MRMKKLWILVAILVVACGIWAVLFRTNLMPKQKSMVSKFIQDVIPGRQKGLIRGIVSSEDSFTALIDTQAVREGDTIYGVKVVKIYVDKVEFEKNGRQWIQGLNETPSLQWHVNAEAIVKDEIGAIEKDPNLTEACISRAVLYHSRGQYDQAISDYTKAIEINPGDALTYYKRGNAYKAKGKYKQAISDYTKSLAIKPRYAEACYYRAIAYMTKSQHDQAISDLTKALEINPRLTEAYLNRGNLYITKGLYDEAILDLDKAIEICPHYAV
ncbi:MAG: tetratricopeptide repeat protein, partial [Sedimentisphaerales bacterium]